MSPSLLVEVTLLAEAFPLCFSALYCHSLRCFGCLRFVLVVSVPRKRPQREWQYNAEKHKGKASASRVVEVEDIIKIYSETFLVMHSW